MGRLVCQISTTVRFSKCRDTRCSVNIDRSSIQSAERNPAAIWDDHGIEGASKMRRLYDLALEISQETCEENTYRSLAMAYGSKNRSTLSGSIKWFFRESRDVPGQVIKRLQSNKHQDEGTESRGKKRKLRDNRKVDVMSLLGNFA